MTSTNLNYTELCPQSSNFTQDRASSSSYTTCLECVKLVALCSFVIRSIIKPKSTKLQLCIIGNTLILDPKSRSSSAIVYDITKIYTRILIMGILLASFSFFDLRILPTQIKEQVLHLLLHPFMF